MKRLLNFVGGLLLVLVAHANAEVTFVHTDHLGSVVAESNASGSITKRFHYKPFGDTFEAQHDDAGYTGHKHDVDLGLTYMQARYYDPVLGRFYGSDPVGIAEHLDGVQGVQGFNRFAYVNNNPYRYTDPDGEVACAGLCIAAAVFVGKVIISAAATYAAAKVAGADNETAGKQAAVGVVVGAVTVPGAGMLLKAGYSKVAATMVQAGTTSAVSQQIVNGEVSAIETGVAAVIAPLAVVVEGAATAVGAPALEAHALSTAVGTSAEILIGTTADVLVNGECGNNLTFGC